MDPASVFLSAAAKAAGKLAAQRILGTSAQATIDRPMKVGRERRTPRPASRLPADRARRLVTEVLHSIVDIDPEKFGLPDGPRVESVLADALTPDGEITTALVVDCRHDPAVLALRLMAPVDRGGLSGDGEHLVDDALALCCEQIVAYFLRQPEVVPATLAQHSRQLDRIEQNTGQNLDDRTDEGAVYLERYRQHLDAHLDELQLFGLRLPREQQTYSLTSAYVRLSLETAADTTSSDFTSLLDRCPRLAVEGPAGCGKTTLLRRLAVHLARRDDDGALGELVDLVPFLLPVRDLARRAAPLAPEEFTSLVAREIEGEKPLGWVTGVLRRGEAILLVDGLDEVRREQRDATVSWLHGLLRTFPDNRYVMTARPNAMNESLGALWTEGFVRARVEPMSRGQVEEFVERWHRPQAHPTIPPAELAERATGLTYALLRRRDLRRLATTPLLCAMLCALSLAHNEDLPKGRTRLYDTAFRMLLGAREAEQGIAADAFRLEEPQLWRILARFADWMFTEGTRQMERDVALTLTAEESERLVLPDQPPTTEEILDYVVARSGVLQQPTADLVEFRHPSLQDFLAAWAVRRFKRFRELVRKLEDSLYQDVFILAVGQAETDDEVQDRLLRDVLESAGRSHRRDLWLLAAAAIADTTARNPEIERQIHEATRRFLPPQNMEQAAELSAAAAPFLLDLLSESLTSGRGLSRHEAAATARVARNHGGVEAYPLLRTLSATPDTDVRVEVLAGLRQSEDRGEYVREVLRGVDFSGCSFTAESPEELEALEVIDGLTELTVHDVPVFDCSVLTHLRGLQMVTLYVEQVRSTALLSRLPHLRMLDLSETTPDAIGFLADAVSLTDLDIDEIDADLDGVVLPPSLVQLSASGTRLRSLEGLAGCTRLEELDVSGTEVADLAPLARCARLTELVLRDTACADLAPLRNLFALASVDLVGTAVEDLTPLSHAEQLLTLRLASTPVHDVAPLAGLPRLRTLDISGTRVTDVTPLALHPTLDHLDLEGSFVADIGPVAHILHTQYTRGRRERG